MKEYTIDVYKNPDILPLKDVILEDYIRHNDVIVVCNDCHGVSRKESWRMNDNKCICGCDKMAEISNRLLSEVTGTNITGIKQDNPIYSDSTNGFFTSSSGSGADKPLIPNAVGWAIAVLAFILVGAGIFFGFKHKYVDTTTPEITTSTTIQSDEVVYDNDDESAVESYSETTTPQPALLSVPNIDESVLNIDSANIEEYSGSIAGEEDSTTYSYTIPVSGRYRFQIEDIVNSNRVSLNIYNDLGECVASDDYCSNGEGLTVKDLEAGDDYKIVVSYCDDATPYTLYIGQQKETVDTQGYNVINDSIEFYDQRNVYDFSPDEDGRYRFEITELHANCRVELLVFNHLGEVIAEDDYCSNNEGLTVKNLSSSENYSIQIRYQDGYSDYTLKIGEQKPILDIDDYDVVSDSIEFTDQRNVYRFTASASTYNFDISDIQNDYRVEILLFNHLDEVVAEDDYCSNGEGIFVDNLTVGEEYELQIRYQDGCTDYKIIIS